jgi:Spy/CpxP family protein refolding chaperone
MKRLLFLFLPVWMLNVSASAQANTGLLDQMLPPEVILPNASELGLDAAQREKLRGGLAPLQDEMRPLQAQMHHAERELVTMLAAARPDEAAVLAKFADLNDLESRVKVLRLKMTLLVKSVLSAEQQTKAMALKKAQPTLPGDGGRIRDKLMRVRDGLARWKQEGRDMTEVLRLWEQFQQFSERHWHQQAFRALDDALKLLDEPKK